MLTQYADGPSRWACYQRRAGKDLVHCTDCLIFFDKVAICETSLTLFWYVSIVMWCFAI